MHRILTRGGIFMHPGTSANSGNPASHHAMKPTPTSWLIEQAMAPPNKTRTLDLQPTNCIERVSVIRLENK
jgi:fructose-1,6-bisphosphatase